MPANLRPVPDSPQSTMTREMNENYSRRYNSMPVLETTEEAATRGTLIRLQVCSFLLLSMFGCTSQVGVSDSAIMQLVALLFSVFGRC